MEEADFALRMIGKWVIEWSESIPWFRGWVARSRGSKFQSVHSEISEDPTFSTKESRSEELDQSSMENLLAELDVTFAKLEADRRKVEPLGQEVEKRFLALGRRMESLHALSSDLVRHSEALLKRIESQEHPGSEIASCIESFHHPMGYVENYHTVAQRLIQNFSEAESHIAATIQCERQFNEAVAPLTYIRTLFRVESAPLDHDLQSMFLALTEEITTLQVQISDIFSKKFTALRTTLEILSRCRRDLSTWLETRGVSIQRKKKQIQTAIEELHLSLRAHQESNQKRTQATKEIEKSVGSLVISLQTQDIVNQKAAHVLESIQGLEKAWRQIRATGDATSQPQLIASLVNGAKIESAQLDSIQSDLLQAESDINRATTHILAQLKANPGGSQANPSEGAHNGTEASSTSTAMVPTLLNVMGDVRELIENVVASAKASYEAIRPIGGEAASVTNTMRQLSTQIRWIALNSQVQATQVGTRRGLEVLAAATAEVANATGAISGRIAADLDAVAHQLNELVSQFQSIHGEGTTGRKTWLGQFGTQEQALGAFDKASAAESQLLRDTWTQLEAQARAMNGSLDLKSFAEDVVGQASRRLLAIADQASHLTSMLGLNPADLLGAGSSHSLTPKRTVTMESERLIQERVLGIASQPAPNRIGNAGGEEPLFFTSDEPAAEGLKSKSDTAEPGTPVQQPESVATSATNNTDSQANLGDNVELF